jgi:hypothetical protein
MVDIRYKAGSTARSHPRGNVAAAEKQAKGYRMID